MAGLAQIRTFQQVRLIAWLRWRLFINMLRSPAAKAELVARFIVATSGVVISGFIALGLGAGAFVIMQTRPHRIGVLLWIVFLGGQFLPVLVSAAGANFDTRTLLRFPMRFSSFVALALSYCAFDPISLSFLLWLSSIGIGAALARPVSAPWIFAVVALLGLVSVLLNRLVLLWAERLLARRRSREILFLTMIMGIVSIQFLVLGLERYEKQIRPLVDVAVPLLGVFPPGLAAAAIISASTVPQTAALLILSLAAWGALISWWLGKRLLAQYRGEEMSEAAAVLPSEKPLVRPAAGGTLVPAILNNQLAALLDKEWRYLFRNAVTVMQLGVPFFLILFFGLMLNRSDTELGFFQRRPDTILPSAIGYAIFIALPRAHNAFSFESWGLHLLLMAPVRFRHVLMAKNLALGLAIYIQGFVVFLLVQLLFGAQTPVMVAATSAALLFMLLLNFTVGNLLSLYFPRAYDFNTFRERPSPWSIIVGILTQLIGMSMVYLVYALAFWRGNTWYAVAAYLLMSAAMSQVYLLVLDRCEEIALARREILVSEICRG